jgi:AmmeMemoRadiSam system protein B
MAGPSGGQRIRQPAVAGSFYPADQNQCRALARQYTGSDAAGASSDASVRWFGGVVPHAGWICSGAIAGLTLATLGKAARKQDQDPNLKSVDLVVVFGAIHTPIPTQLATLDSFGSWLVPGDSCDVQAEIRQRVAETSGSLFCVDDRFHFREHAVEVELPLIRSVWPEVTILPVEVPLAEDAVEIGRRTAQVVAAAKLEAVFLASSDLTHYGPNYGFAPAGVGLPGIHWAKHNDRPLIDLVLQLRQEAIVPEVKAHANACGGGAIAATLAACREFGATQARLLRHATSFETLASVAPQRPDNAVGYASIVIG